MLPDTAVAVVKSLMVVVVPAWAAGEILMRRSPERDKLARTIWTGALALMLVHVWLAFQLVYGWDHDRAVTETARRTAEAVGTAWRGAIYVNYVFLAIWIADAWWWWANRAAHAARSRGFETARAALFVFMFVNASIVFASGLNRVIGSVSIAAVLLAAFVSRRNPAALSTGTA
jgi:hypothetical protein